MLSVFVTRFNKLSKGYYGLFLQIKLARDTKEFAVLGIQHGAAHFERRDYYAVRCTKRLSQSDNMRMLIKQVSQKDDISFRSKIDSIGNE
jgi:hypothetical protein